MDAEQLSETLEALSDPAVARKQVREVRTIKGIRGTPHGEVARIAAAAWQEDRPRLPGDADALDALFGSAWEDGLLAIALLAGALPDNPTEALDIGRSWLDRIDDLQSADGLGWVVLGPAVLATGAPIEPILTAMRQGHPAVRRAGVMMAMAMLPVPVTGPCAAALRERLGTRVIQFVEVPMSDGVRKVVDAFVRDETPAVRKAVRRVLGAWAGVDPQAAEDWLRRQPSPARMLRSEIEKAARKARRKAGATT